MYWEKLYVLIFLTARFHILKEFHHFATSRVQLNGALWEKRKKWKCKINKVELLIWKGQLTLSQTSPGFMCLQFKSFENTGKEDVARKEQFLLFQQ